MNLLFWWILLLLLVPPVEPDKASDKTVIRAKNVTVEIAQQELQAVGGWPIERRWYGLAIENLLRQGADSIFIDIAFPKSDPLRTESDRFFYNVMITNKTVYLQNSQSTVTGDSIFIMGSMSFPVDRTILPFSESVSVAGDFILLNKIPDFSLASHQLDRSYRSMPISVELPDALPSPDLSFLQVLKNEFEINEGANVFLFLNHPGVTSYISTSGNNSYPSSLVQWWAVNEIKDNRFSYLWSDWYYLAVSLFFVISSLVAFSRNTILMRIYGASYIFGVSAFLVAVVLQAYIPDYIYYSMVVPLPFFAFYFMRERSVQNLPEEYFESREQVLSPKERKELEDLRYRIGFYDKLKQAASSPENRSFNSKNVICHENSPLNSVLIKAHNVAQTNIPVLITGESGTGKEELARFIHRYSKRAEQPFVALNCGSLNENLIESELFGYEKGAFTGAEQTRPGRFELADGGTLFLDEIAETSPAFQVKLLRVLQEGTFERVGGTKMIRTSVRIITATHQNIKKRVAENEFREDLYYRLNGFSFHLPALRERKMDIPVLFEYFAEVIARDDPIKYSASLLEWLKLQPWYGNIRELKSATERAVLNARIQKREIILPEDFELEQPVTVQNEKAVQMLELFKQYSNEYRFISKVADLMDMHRISVTEYLRGWIIYYLARDLNINQIAYELLGDHKDDEAQTQLADRIQTYHSTIQSRIQKGIKQKMNREEIESAYFGQVPKFFSEDLQRLVSKFSTMKNPEEISR